MHRSASESAEEKKGVIIEAEVRYVFRIPLFQRRRKLFQVVGAGQNFFDNHNTFICILVLKADMYQTHVQVWSYSIYTLCKTTKQ